MLLWWLDYTTHKAGVHKSARLRTDSALPFPPITRGLDVLNTWPAASCYRREMRFLAVWGLRCRGPAFQNICDELGHFLYPWECSKKKKGKKSAWLDSNRLQCSASKRMTSMFIQLESWSAGWRSAIGSILLMEPCRCHYIQLQNPDTYPSWSPVSGIHVFLNRSQARCFTSCQHIDLWCTTAAIHAIFTWFHVTTVS